MIDVHETGPKRLDIDEDDVRRSMPACERALAGRDRVDMLARIDAFDGFDPGLLGDRDHWRMERDGLRKLRRYAIVTSIGWLAGAAGLAGRLTSVEIRVFEPSEEGAARAWLDEGTEHARVA